MSEEIKTAMLFRDEKPHQVFAAIYYEALDRIEFACKEYNPSGEMFKETIAFALRNALDKACKETEKHHLDIEYKRSIESSNNMFRAIFAFDKLQSEKEK